MQRHQVSTAPESWLAFALRATFSISLLVLLPTLAKAETIEFPEEELATESVLPVFDKKVVVRERLVNTAGRFEIGGGTGLNLVEPLYAQMTFNASATYHINELHGVNVAMYMLSDELSGAATDLRNGKGLIGNSSFDVSVAPRLESLFFANYQFTAYYGKLSITKQTMMNLTLYGLVGAGMANWSDAAEMAVNFGVGQKLYFNSHLALRVDLTMAVYQGPDPTHPKVVGSTTLNSPQLDSDDFNSTTYFRPFLSGALVYMF